jgi:LPXTG-motif cell wall-anchored protein
MKRSKILVAMFLGSLTASLAAQTEEWPATGGPGVDRASAASKPNEAGALPESAAVARRDAPDGAAQQEPYDPAPAAAQSAAEPAAESDSSPAAAERELPQTDSPLAILGLSGLTALAAGGGLYRLRREQRQ